MNSSAPDSSNPGPAPLPGPEPRDFWQLFDDLPTGVLLLDTEGVVLRASDLAAERFGRAAMEMLGQDLFRESFPSLEHQGIGEEYRRQVAAGQLALEREVQLPASPEERRLWLGIRSLRLHDVTWGVLVVEDRSALAAEEERRKRAERLAAVGELAAGVAHEINNPLASVQSFAQLLAREATGGEQQRALEIIIQESARIARVVENLQSFVRQQGVSGREPVNLSELAEQVLELQRYSLEAVGIEVRRDLDDDLSPVMGERGALQQMIVNLVANAEKALTARPGPRMLIVRTRESSEGVLISVVDNGRGIPRDRLPHIFDAYGNEQVSEAELGLGICATIAREHGGQIVAESEEGRGTAFFVRLPRAGEKAVRASRPAPPSRAPSTQPRRSLRVLVADDEPTLRLAISLFLGRRGHRVTEAEDAHVALRLAQENEFDVALVDARMPGDGLRLLEQLEAMPALQGRTALMTGDLGRTRTSQGITTGRPYLVKPFDMTEAVNLIEKLGQ